MIGLRGMLCRRTAAMMKPAALLMLLTTVVAPAWAGSFDLGHNTSAQYTLTLGYALAMRTGSAADALVNGPIDPTTGLPTTVNSDDGDRNFKSGSLINNRASALGELFLTHENFGAVLRGDAFYDNVYHPGNDNDSPSTVNKGGANDAFSAGARKYDGGRVRFLDAYLYGDWSLGGTRHLNLRAGRQVVAWGESVFFSGVASAQGPADATKANVPGAEVKDILLPVNQVAMQLALNNRLSLMGYYKLQYKATELEPAGAYFSTSDVVGPGAQFIYGAPGFTIPRASDIRPSDYGQWGAGLKFQATQATNVGLYWLRYHDTNPEVQLNIAEVAPGVYAPTSYNIRYFDGIRMAALSFSTSVGPANVAGEVSYRDGVDMLVNGAAGPTATRGRLSQALLSSIYTVAPNFISQEIDLVGEVGYIHVNGVDPAGGSSTLTNDRNSWGYEGIATFNYRNVFPKWDLAVPLTYAGIAKGNPAMAGAFGSLYGEGDQRLSVAANFIYLQNFQAGVGYNAFLGSPNLSKRPYADRDYAAINLKYSF
ncbi:MAG: DUF1302 domain-containing protein [Stenotrophobium sp.]